MSKLPIVVFSTNEEYIVIYDGEILESYSKEPFLKNGKLMQHNILAITKRYKSIYEASGYVVDIDNTIYNSPQDAWEMYQASYNTNTNFIINDSQETIINTPIKPGINIMDKQEERVIRGVATVQVASRVGVSAVFGTAHLVFQTAADLTALAEGVIVKKVLKFNVDVDQVIKERKLSTMEKQLFIQEKSFNAYNAVKKRVPKIMSPSELYESMKNTRKPVVQNV